MQRTTDISRLEREGSVGPGAATGQVQGQGQGQDQKSKTKPGEWRSKRAEDEYQRAMEFVVDKDFSLSESSSSFWSITFLSISCHGCGRGLWVGEWC